MYAYNLALHFEEIATEFADRPALWIDEASSINYSELNALSNRIARFLKEQGLAQRDVICLSGDKSPITFAAIIASLKIGAIYCVLDPESPLERVRKILSTCRPKLLIGRRELLVSLDLFLSAAGIQVAAADYIQNAVHDKEEFNLLDSRAVTGASPAYIMFTSGSTGVPKGAVMTHQNVLNLISWSRQTYKISSSDRLTNVNPLYFDNSVFDFYSALFNGACLVPFSKAEVQDPKALVDKVAAASCTLWFSVPSLLIFLQTMRATDGRNLRSIRRFVFGGEGYPKAKLKKLFDTYDNTSEFFNVYGPTECTCICSSYRLSADDFADLRGLPPLGYIAENFYYLLLDEDSRPVPPGEIGELFLGGANVGAGYYNDHERTAASFMQNPLHHDYRDIVYRTGDMARLEPTDGKLYIQGRRDNQIKHMGYRIELEEIEAAMHCLDYVAEATALHVQANGLSHIVAVVAPRAEFDDDQMRRDLGKIIPAYMIPSLINREASLPKNANGKVDRRLLAEKYRLATGNE